MMKLYRTRLQQFPIKNLKAPKVKLPNMVYGREWVEDKGHGDNVGEIRKGEH